MRAVWRTFVVSMNGSGVKPSSVTTDSEPQRDPEPETGPSLVFEKDETAHSVVEDVVGMLTGAFAVSLGLYFLSAAGAVTGGTAGLSLLMVYALDWPFALVFALINVPFALLAVWQRGWIFTIRTVIAVALVSGFSVVHERLLVLTSVDPLYGALGGSLIAGVGVLIIFRHRASLGGFNVIALVLQDRLGFRAGWTMMALDVVVVAASALVVPWTSVLISAAGAVVLNLVLALNHRPGRYIGH